MKMLWILLFVLAVLLLLTGTTGATNYYVAPWGNNANAGTLSEPWQNISNATQRAIAGDTIYLINGTWYGENAVFANSGSVGSPIILTSYNGTPIMDGQNNTNLSNPGNRALNINSYINISNIVIHDYNVAYVISAKNNININNVTVYNVTGEPSGYSTLFGYAQGSGYGAIQLIDSNNIRIENSIIHDTGGMRVDTSQFVGQSTLRVDTSAAATGMNNITIHNNTIYSNPGTSQINSSSGHGFVDASSNSVTGILKDINVTNNTMYTGTTAVGVGFRRGDSTRSEIESVIVAYNNISGMPSGIAPDFVNNITIRGNLLTTLSNGILKQDAVGRYQTMIDNIFSGNSLDIYYRANKSNNDIAKNNTGNVRMLAGNITVINPYTQGAKVRLGNAGDWAIVKYDTNTYFSENGVNTTYYYNDRSEYIVNTTSEVTFTKYNRTLQPSHNNVTSTNTSTIWNIDYSSNTIPRLNFTLDKSSSVNLSGLTQSNYTLYGSNGTLLTSVTSSSNMANFSTMSLGSYYITEASSPEAASARQNYVANACVDSLNWGVVGSAMIIILILVLAGGLAIGFMTGQLNFDTFPIMEFTYVLIAVVCIGAIGVGIISPIINLSCP